MATGNLSREPISHDSAGVVDLVHSSGVSLIDSRNLIGGSVAGAGNLISGNGFGVLVSGATATANRIEGNRIGTDAAGIAPLGNSNQGVLLDNGSAGTTVGGSEAAGNIIAFNSLGVSVVGLAASTGNAFRNPSLATTVGIDLGGDSVTANDFPMPSRANNLQNYPSSRVAIATAPCRTARGMQPKRASQHRYGSTSTQPG